MSDIKEKKPTSWADIIHVINCLLLAGFFMGIGFAFAVKMILL